MSDSVRTSALKTAAAGSWGVVTLNQEKSLNSLTLEMIQEVSAALRIWATDNSIVGITLQGAGEKAFCAGGDIRMLYEAMKTNPGRVQAGAANFFKHEYDLDYLIHVYPKPILCIGHGIVMGGGLGLMAGASHRVLSERSTVAMPEITIGLYPDVGASWFLNRMPGRLGLYLGLTGTRLKAADALFVGLGDHYVERQNHAKIAGLIEKTAWAPAHDHVTNHAKLSKLLKTISSPLPPSELRNHFDIVQRLTDGESLTEVWNLIKNYDGTDEWVQAGRKAMLAGSPTSAHVIWEQLRRSKHLSLKQCFELELDLSCQFAAHPDFPEGIRALLIDKDLAPKWTPAGVEDVRTEWVDEHFRKGVNP